MPKAAPFFSNKMEEGIYPLRFHLAIAKRSWIPLLKLPVLALQHSGDLTSQLSLVAFAGIKEYHSTETRRINQEWNCRCELFSKKWLICVCWHRSLFAYSHKENYWRTKNWGMSLHASLNSERLLNQLKTVRRFKRDYWSTHTTQKQKTGQIKKKRKYCEGEGTCWGWRVF